MGEFFEKLTQNRLAFGAIAALAAFIVAVLSTEMTSVQTLELKSYDLRFALRGEQDVSDSDIVIIAFDELSLTSIPARWPFPRSLFARALKNLKRAGARMVLFDLELSDPDYKNPTEDQALFRATREFGDVLYGANIVDKGNIYELVLPFEGLRRSGAQWGLINALEDQDGFIRRYFLFLPYKDKLLAPLSIVAYEKLMGVKAQTSPTHGPYLLGNLRIPRFNSNTMLINYRGPAGTFQTHSFVEVVDDRSYDIGEDDDNIFDEYHLPEQTFRDKIVFIGASAEILQDNKLTPFFEYQGVKQKMPGVETHANALSTLMRGDFIRKIDFRWQMLLMFVLALLSVSIALQARPGFGLLFVSTLAALYAGFSYWTFTELLVWVDVVSPTLAILFAYIGGVVQQVVIERREKGRVRKTFQQYVAPSVVDTMLESGEEPEYGGQKKELTVLFSDIRGFTTFTERHTPEFVVTSLNEYLTAMTEIVIKHLGTLDKYVGDAIMAVYGAPVDIGNHAERACATACEMIASLRDLQRRWSQDSRDYFQIGIGINTGPMIVGNLGSQQLFDYTVIGDEVNLAARLEGTTKQYWTSIIISESTYLMAKEKAIARELDLVRVKGKIKPVKIYELRSMEPIPDIEYDLLIRVYSRALELYKQQRWYEALKQFKRVLHYFPSDGPSRVYIRRCLDFIEMPPPADWDGVYEFTSK